MALNKEQKVVGIAILEDDSVKVSTKVIVKDGDNMIAEKNDYYVLSKLDSEGEATDISGENSKVQSVCNIAWAE
jgi:hypothetical protein|tara:strand:- start:2268 stop:2489 length:222 start_codon:yes stop_codon:yes gene_type:complete